MIHIIMNNAYSNEHTRYVLIVIFLFTRGAHRTQYPHNLLLEKKKNPI